MRKIENVPTTFVVLYQAAINTLFDAIPDQDKNSRIPITYFVLTNNYIYVLIYATYM